MDAAFKRAVCETKKKVLKLNSTSAHRTVKRIQNSEYRGLGIKLS